MNVIAGVDVGNTTTEIVIARLDSGGPQFIGAGRRPTGAVKGSTAALRHSLQLLETLETEHDVRAQAIVLARQQPVLTFEIRLSTPPDRTSPLALVTAGTSTPSGQGVGLGVAASLADPAPEGRPVVLLVDREWDFEDAARQIGALGAAGVSIAAVLVEADEAHLIGNRIGPDVPVVDEVDLAAVPMGELVAVEVALPGGAPRRLADPLWLASQFSLAEEELGRLEALTRRLADARCAIVVRRRAGGEAAAAPRLSLRASVNHEQRRIALPADTRLVKFVAPGSVRDAELEHEPLPVHISGGALAAVRDVFAADLDDLSAGAWLRENLLHLDRQPLALLGGEVPVDDLLDEARAVFERPVVVAATETTAARLGALTTPAAPTSSCICDLGGGTIDVIHHGEHLTAAGGGQLLTETVASLLDIPVMLAEVVKRGPCLHVETPHLARTETGEKLFLEVPASPALIGRLCVADGPVMRAFSDRLGPEEWRTIRLGLKRQLLGGNVIRCLQELSGPPGTVLLAGGVAQDSELAATIAGRTEGGGPLIATADVAGRFGPRYAAAVGLILCVVESPELIH